MAQYASNVKDHGFSVAQPPGDEKRERITTRLQEAAKKVVALGLLEKPTLRLRKTLAPSLRGRKARANLRQTAAIASPWP